ncbi:MAG: choice-of-anchor Q domain-containing protein [Kiritimatiellia bacterium]
MSSPARNAADTVHVYGEFDLDGNPRTAFSAADLGCYENQSSSGTMLILR